MGKKRRGPSLDERLARPWCYYCERDFDDLKILISHQKAKHFKCERCGRRLNTAGGLLVHMSQVHKEQLAAVDNALPNRTSLDVEIFGMEGVPEDIIQSHNQRVTTQFHQEEQERQAATGNPPAGAATGGQPAKKPKLENTSDLKKRLAEHKAKRAEAIVGGSSGEGTPVGAGQSVQTAGGLGQPPQNASAPYPQPYGSSTSPYQQTASPVYSSFSPGQQQLHPAQYTTSGYSPQPLQTGVQGQPAQPYGNAPSPFSQQPTPQFETPPQTTSAFPQRPGSLPNASNLPQRPSFGAPPVNAFQMQQLHMGHPAPQGQAGAANGEKGPDQEAGAIPASVDDLVSGAAKQADEAAGAAPPTAAAAAEEKPAKKEKAKQTRLIYSDNEVSPEEKMARLPRYAFVPDRQGETVLGELPSAVVVGTIRESGTVTDPAK
ncbi:C2H2 finger domain protein [Aspergillus sp. HF37]|nr:C2H2 finger domain protein [Aspergillus sp. HF37]